MSRIEKAFMDKAYIGYLTAGDPDLEKSAEYFLALVEGGVNLLEIGIPFSDPIADGSVIQKAMQRALEQRVLPKDVLKIVKKVREKSEVPILLFSYYNPILQMGESFIEEAKAAGADGLLIVDLPMEEAETIKASCDKYGLDLIFILSVSTSKERIEKINRMGKGFLYYACRKGTTGAKKGLPEGFKEKMNEIHSSVTLPVAIGFGISNRQSAEKVIQHGDGFVVGSFFVKAIEQGASPKELSLLAKKLDPRSLV